MAKDKKTAVLLETSRKLVDLDRRLSLAEAALRSIQTMIEEKQYHPDLETKIREEISKYFVKK